MEKCEFCKKYFSNKKTLTCHQKTTKYCLAIQNKVQENDETTEINNNIDVSEKVDKIIEENGISNTILMFVEKSSINKEKIDMFFTTFGINDTLKILYILNHPTIL